MNAAIEQSILSPIYQVYYEWLKKCHSKFSGYSRTIRIIFWTVAVLICCSGLFLIPYGGYALVYTAMALLVYVFVAQVLITIVDYLILIPNLSKSHSLDEVFSTPVETDVIFDELKVWAQEINDKHRSPMGFMAWVLMIGSFMIFTWVIAIPVYLYWVILKEFLLKTCLALITLKNTSVPAGTLAMVIVVPVLILSLLGGPFVSWYIEADNMVHFSLGPGPYIGYFFSVITLGVPTVVLRSTALPLLEKRRQGIWQ